jgi:hypothetical protein
LPKGMDTGRYKELQQQHQAIAKMRDNFQPYEGGKQLPTEVLSEEMGQSKMLGGMLSNERAIQIALASVLGASHLVPGLPDVARGGIDATALAMMGPSALPEAGPYVGKALGGTGKAMQAPANSKKFMDALSQLGIRLPSAGQGQGEVSPNGSQ